MTNTETSKSTQKTKKPFATWTTFDWWLADLKYARWLGKGGKIWMCICAVAYVLAKMATLAISVVTILYLARLLG